ncbi:MAG: hypothetical protein MJ241_07075 [Bacilli bacterium]|nr:hypothetical protein [Bacilli bacterium]
MQSENILEKMKKALLIPATEHYADDEINLHIASCRQLLVSAGVPREIAEGDDDSLVTALITIYVKTNFGFDSKGEVKQLPNHFDILLRQLCLHTVEVKGGSSS